jgi:hypothetical protein
MIYDVNPIHVDVVQILVPVANEVGIEVMGEPVIEPKRERVPDDYNNNTNTSTSTSTSTNNTSNIINNNNNNIASRCSCILDWAYIYFLILIILGIFGGLIALLVWLNDPRLFAYSPT